MNLSHMTTEERAEYLAGELIERARQGRADIRRVLANWEQGETAGLRRAAELARRELGAELEALEARS